MIRHIEFRRSLTLRGAFVPLVSLMIVAATAARVPAANGLSPGPVGTSYERDYRVPLTWITKAGQFTPGDYGRWLYVGDRFRYYEAHLPDNYRAGTPLPLVMVLHGGGGYAAFMRYQSGMDEVSDEQDFIVLYPAGSHQTYVDRCLFWNAGVAQVHEKQRGVDDVAYIRAVLDDAQRMFSVDPQRVYACGMSNGAQMCYLLAARMPYRIAAIGAVASQRSVAQYAPTPLRPMPLIAFHGTSDLLWAPFTGGISTAAIFQLHTINPAREAIASWVDFNECAVEPLVFDQGNAHGLAYAGEADVVYWELTGGGHTWPGGKCSIIEEEKLGVGAINRDIDASRLIWEFFQQQTLGE
jgi:polyhydroxybutyrate depolymerase